MVELPSSGDSFTWGGKRYDLYIRCKLDRCFGNKMWFKMFPVATQVFLDKRGSDHRPILISLVASNDFYRGSFKFDKRFLNKPLVKDTILRCWSMAHKGGFGSVTDKIREVRKGLSLWKKESNVNSLDNIKKIEIALKLEQSSFYPKFNHIWYLKKELMFAYKEEEAYWSHRCRDHWVLEGDRNTKFFHNSVKANREIKKKNYEAEGFY